MLQPWSGWWPGPAAAVGASWCLFQVAAARCQELPGFCSCKGVRSSSFWDLPAEETGVHHLPMPCSGGHPCLHLCGVSPWHRAQPCCPRLVFLRSNGGGQMGGPSRQFPRHQPSWAAIRMEIPWLCCRHSQLHPAPALHLRAEKGGDMAV